LQNNGKKGEAEKDFLEKVDTCRPEFAAPFDSEAKPKITREGAVFQGRNRLELINTHNFAMPNQVRHDLNAGGMRAITGGASYSIIKHLIQFYNRLFRVFCSRRYRFGTNSVLYQFMADAALCGFCE
jgi:hypothetical protein